MDSFLLPGHGNNLRAIDQQAVGDIFSAQLLRQSLKLIIAGIAAPQRFTTGISAEVQNWLQPLTQ
jgi:hypothetical protein